MADSREVVSAFPLPERTSETQLVIVAEPAFRSALQDGLDRLELGDRNLLRFHHFHGLTIDQLARMFASSPAAVVGRLARIRRRVLRDTRRGLAARLELDRHQLDRLLEIADSRLELAIQRLLRG